MGPDVVEDGVQSWISCRAGKESQGVTTNFTQRREKRQDGEVCSQKNLLRNSIPESGSKLGEDPVLGNGQKAGK